MWAQGTRLTPEQAARALPAAGPMTLGLFWGLAGTGGGLAAVGLLVGTLAGQPELAAILSGVGAALALPGLLTPGSFFRSLHKKPVGAADIENLLAAASGGQGNELERAYLNLVLTAIRQPATTPEAETDVRDALRALGEAIDHLPLGMGGSGGALLVDADALRREPAATLDQAEHEPDDVIADSLRRRSEALLRSAEAAGRSSLLLRRADALKNELLAQTEALRLGLVAFDAGAGGTTSSAAWGAGADLSRLAESVRDVAREAQNVVLARDELDGAITTPSANTPPSLPQTVGGARS